MKYKIGDVSRILGISPDLLRYYEKKGIVHPVKDKDNDYRYYEAWDINFLMDCIWFKNFGFSIDKVAKIINKSSTGEISAIFTENEKVLKDNIRRCELLLRRSEQHREALKRIRPNLWKCRIDHSPEIIRYIHRYNYIYDNSPKLQKLSQRWLKYMPFVTRCFEIPENSLKGCESEEYQWGFSLDMEYVREFNVPAEPPVVHIPSQRSIYSVFSSRGKNAFSPKLLKYIVDYADENGYEICGGAQGNLLASALDNGVLTGFFEVWVPIKE
ncbi:MAG: MerR family transcriptional regulator [Oscillospiraceae bacterium]